ncbi:MAG: SpoIIE family protein phosphatase [Flavobacteriales bacterium]|jgi:serine phosphatase RsbU (regulator of sigma subunit)|nr:SpoIIE family protein phosphatase [Flavobacteriales bacterium]
MKKLFLFILLFPLFNYGQTDYIDSLTHSTYHTPHEDDSVQMFNYVLLVRAHIANQSLDSLLPVSIKAIEYAKQTNNPEHLTTAYNLNGVYYKTKKEFKKAIEIFNIGKQYAEKIAGPARIKCVLYHNLNQSHNILGNIDSAVFYAEKTYQAAVAAKNVKFQSISLSAKASYNIKVGAYDSALENLNNSLKLAIDLQDTSRIISANLDIGKVLADNDKYDELIVLYNKLLEDYDSITLSSKMDLINLNMGAAYSELGNQEKSLEHTYKVLNSNSNLRRGLAHGNIGETFLKLLNSGVPPSKIPLLQNVNLEHDEQQNEAIILNIISDHFTKSFDDFDEINAANYKVFPLKNLGEYYDYTKDYKKSVQSFEEAWAIAEEKNLMYEKRVIAKRLYEQYKQLNKAEQSLIWHEKFVEISDSLNSTESQQEVGRQLAQFEFTNIRLKDSLEQVKKDAIQQLQIEQQNQNIKNERLKKYYLYGGLAIALFLLLFLFRRFNITQKQKRLIELQKAAMEEKQIELSKTHLAIKDSINYSRKIQKAIFPSQSEITSIFPNNFVLFKPKDIVSGDFYWCYEANNKKVIVLGDCTGHGVPGAFMTIIGINILKEILHDEIYESAEILKAVNHKLKNRLNQNNDSINDGMDLGVCVIDDQMIEFSGAHFPIYHVSENQLVEYKGSNIFLGNDDEVGTIKTHYIPYQKGDLIYLVTDGFPDQRGGEKGKKYYYKPLRTLLQSNAKHPLKQQKENINKEFESWLKNSNQKQMDDVSIIGIKF